MQETMDWRDRGRMAALTVGIILMPYLFAWFTLRRGFSPAVRVASFGWLALVAYLVIFTGPESDAIKPRANLTGMVTNADTGSNVVYPAEKPSNEVAQYNAARIAAYTVKNSVRDPDSLRFDSIRVSDDANTICVLFGARNGFGGMNRERVTYFNGTGSQSASSWNRRCLKSMADMTFAAP